MCVSRVAPMLLGVYKVAAVVILVIAINVLPRVVGVPAIDLPSIDLPDLPDWLQHVNRVKNLIIGGLIVLGVVGALLKTREKDRDQ